MDTTDPNIVFDEDGICNHCTQYFEVWENRINRRPIEKVWKEIRERAKSNYDAILGVSGGADSCMVAYLAKKADMNILLVHADDGWNTEAAKKNVELTAKHTGFEFLHKKLNQQEFSDILISYFKAGVPSLEAPTDLAIRTIIHDTMDEYDINNIINGGNWQTEGILPTSWAYDNRDAKNIRDIHRKFGTIPLKETRFMSILSHIWRITIGGKKEYRPLNHVDYRRDKAKKILGEEWGWVDYGRKHNENRYTKFVECYIFPKRFGFDKRLAHYSTLICSGEMTRDEALRLLDTEPLYADEEKEKEFFLNKLGMTEKEFEDYMNLPIRSNDEFATNKTAKRLVNLARKILR